MLTVQLVFPTSWDLADDAIYAMSVLPLAVASKKGAGIMLEHKA